MTPRPDVSEERKAQILEAATAVFSRLGFHNARMDDIAEEAGLSKGTLYLYFEGKDALISALLEAFYRRAMGDLPATLAAPGSAGERLSNLARGIADQMRQMLVEFPLSFEFYAIAVRQQAIREFLKDYFAQSHDILSAILQQGIDAGEFRADLDAAAVALLMGAMFEGLGLLWMVDPESVEWDHHTKAAIDLLMKGLPK